jgi:hypothetical protein
MLKRCIYYLSYDVHGVHSINRLESAGNYTTQQMIPKIAGWDLTESTRLAAAVQWGVYGRSRDPDADTVLEVVRIRLESTRPAAVVQWGVYGRSRDPDADKVLEVVRIRLGVCMLLAGQVLETPGIDLED